MSEPAPTSPEDISAEVAARFAATPDARVRRLLQSLVGHIHAFAIENELTEAEWSQAISFMTRAGQISSDSRQELILLSDVLGLSMVLDAVIHEGRDPGVTESTVLGPFYVEDSPWREMGDSISTRPEDGEETLVTGRVLDSEGQPIAGAVLDVWQNASTGMYAVQDADQPGENLRGRFETGADGRFWFRSVLPTDYQIPSDGPVGDLLRAAARHPWRPAHLHVIVSAPGFERVVTHLFDDRSRYLDSDAVFGVKQSLICHFVETGVDDGPHYRLDRDLVLSRTSGTAES
jgi:protocatechuate 3,4-dioxygenase beta subunit